MIPHLLLLQCLLFMDFGDGLLFDYKTDQCFAIKDGAISTFCNRVCNAAVPAPSEIEHIKKYFGDVPFRWFVDETDMPTISRLQAQGLCHKNSFSAMFADLNDIQPLIYKSGNYKSDIIVEEVFSNTDVRTCLAIIAQSFKISPTMLKKSYSYLVKRARPGSIHVYWGLCNNKPVSASIMVDHHDIVTLHWVSTLVDFRNHGLGYAVSHKPLRDARLRGFKQAALLAPSTARAIYQRLGFRQYAVYKTYGI